MTGSLLDQDARQRIVERLATLRDDDAPRWGQLTPLKLLGHLGDALDLGAGHKQLPQSPTGFFTTRFGRWFIIDSPLPWPKGVKVPDLLFETKPQAFDMEREAVIGKIETFANDPARAGGEHPLMGRLSRAQWGRLHYRHVDHHLRQFGR